MKLSSLFHIFKVKTETALDKLISVETKLDVALKDNLDALEKQKENSKKLFSAEEKFNFELEKVRKEVSRYKTQVEVMKNRGLKKEDDDMRIAAAQYLEHKNMLEDLEKQGEQIKAQSIKVEKILKRLNLNKALLETKASALRTKIEFYRISENITDDGVIDMDNTFNDIDEIIRNMEYDQNASRRVNDLVNGSARPQSAKDAELDAFIDNL